MDLNKFQQSRIRHSVLTQYYRWFQVYERPFTDERIQNQINLFDKNILIESLSNTAKSADEYKEKLNGFSGTTNAHHVQNSEIKLIDDNTIQLNAQIIYQGIRNNNEIINSHIHYHTLLSFQKNNLPLFNHIKLEFKDHAPSQPYKDAYSYNRAVSLMHYWLYLIESNQGIADLFKELLADKFQLDLSPTNSIQTWDQFEIWIKTISQNIKASAHYEKNLTANENKDGTITLTMHFDWNGLNSQNQAMVAATQHVWILENNPNHRFARIKKMTVKQMTPFQVVEKFETEF